ncbi:methionine biosynthesis protein MetW [Phaeovibrio sulfidiphilus]|uniref:Methionine biosynthesis protein MetW n=1 Tax=Phaeovibrio sulfidiphilus TaxID=1220600 RepID=A0A8J7CRC3_9PROT|nr:methionine biosynthesis protein MetW [Phaeovibrio sulfidiphilus]MBE1237560.1 methionine biosynthesis protein MetW [Phaeovibrio sulfidiphilus]
MIFPKRLKGPIRDDLQLIGSMIPHGARVLDVGCGNGELLAWLAHEKQVDGRGVELSMAGVRAAVARGVAVIQGDADTDLDDYPDDAFDYAILSQTLQATERPREVLGNLVRISRRSIVSFPNFGNWRSRFQLMFRGRMPVGDCMPHEWWQTPNIHLCTTRDFLDLCSTMGIVVEKAIALDARGQACSYSGQGRFANLFGVQSVFVLTRHAGR